MTSVSGHIAQELVSSIRPLIAIFADSRKQLEDCLRVLRDPASPPEAFVAAVNGVDHISDVMSRSDCFFSTMLEDLGRPQPLTGSQWQYEAIVRLGALFKHEPSSNSQRMLEPGRVLPAQYNILAFAWYNAYFVEYAKIAVRIINQGGYAGEIQCIQMQYAPMRVRVSCSRVGSLLTTRFAPRTRS